jgi:ribosomal protein L7Ae-like RNA K-turn-binding protein
MNERSYGFLGLLNRGGKLLIGSSLLDHFDQAKLIIIADDASPNTKKAATDKASFRNLEVLSTPTKEELGQALGYDQIGVVGVTDIKASAHLKDLWKGV